MASGERKRKLPAWMEEEEEASEPRGFRRRLPLLPLSAHLLYCASRRSVDLYCASLLRRLTAGRVVLGFDAEWDVVKTAGQRSPLALLQMCDDQATVALLHLHAVGDLPESARRVIQHPNALLVGLNIAGDLWKLARDFRLPEALRCVQERTCDLSALANERLRTGDRWSLRGLVRRLLHRDLDKASAVRETGWQVVPLRREQQEYAGRDALASLLVYRALSGEQVSTEATPAEYPRLERRVQVRYCDETASVDGVCSRWLERLAEEKLVLGFSAAWNEPGKEGQKPSRLALLQMCDDQATVALLHLRAVGDLPESARRVIQHPSALLAGLGVRKALWKLARDFRLPEALRCVQEQCCDLSALANERLLTDERWSLQNLVRTVLRADLHGHAPDTDWEEVPLRTELQDCAAMNAYASLLVYLSLTQPPNDLQ